MAEDSTNPDLALLTKRFLEAVNARDVDALMSFYAPHVATDVTGIGVFEGHASVRGFFEDWFEMYGDFEMELVEFRDLGEGVTFSVVSQRGRLPGSTGWVQTRYAAITTWVDALIERTIRYPDIDQGRAAAERLTDERG